MDTDLVLSLERIGLSEKEAKVYLATLELAEASVQDIARQSGVNRATTYLVLGSLQEKGFVSTYEKGKKTVYVAEDPSLLKNMFSAQEQEIRAREEQLNDALPQLQLIHNRSAGKPVIRFFEGKEGLKTMVQEVRKSFDAGKEDVVRVIYPADRVADIFSDSERRAARDARLERNLQVKSLYTKRGGELASATLSERIRISQQEFPIDADITLFNGNISISSLGDRLSGVLIQDEAIYRTLASMFDLAWEAAKARHENNKEQ